MTNRSESAAKVQHLSTALARASFALAITLILAGSSTPGEVALRQPGPVQSRAIDWLKFDTNACGRVGRVEGRRSVLNRSSAKGAADYQYPYGNSWANAWGMSDDAAALAQEWSLENPRVAIVTEAVEKSCGDDMPEDQDVGTTAIA